MTRTKSTTPPAPPTAATPTTPTTPGTIVTEGLILINPNGDVMMTNFVTQDMTLNALLQIGEARVCAAADQIRRRHAKEQEPSK